ncbi:hypothetical protein NBRC110019_14740 [Neptunitalea chrysea]|uniref:Uncharacterized protein n=1 Tax=Neptunitalea chrysea TaxID=1647581 RepID=A0A9W6B4J5_9FLAO|nr:hypothetical protein [Neptunitalea chrysea]GLB52434.1 hypothetical protein NBRC110019_14740 [Neptunitalea chrysea]
MIFLKKIPLIFYAVIAIGLAMILTRYFETFLIQIEWILILGGSSKIALYTGVLTVLTLHYGVFQLQIQRKNDLLANEYINQPEFKFLKFLSGSRDKTSLIDNSPCCCFDNKTSSFNNCKDEHWFDIEQNGKLPASNVIVVFFHSKENNNIEYDSRIKKAKTLIKGDCLQYKLPPFTFKKEFHSKGKNDSFFALISYRSLYSGIRYKRIYELDYSSEKELLDNEYWKDSIKFYSIKLIDISDEKTIRLKDVIIGNLAYLFYRLKFINSLSKENWIKNINFHY